MSQVLGALSPMSMALPSDATSSGAAGIVGTMSTPQSHGYAQIFSQTNSSLQNTIVSSGSSSLETAQTNMSLQTSGNHELGGQSSAMLPPPMIPPGQLPVSITPLSQIPNSFPQTSQPPSVYAAPAHIFTSNQAPAVQSQTQNSSLGGRPLSLPGQSQATPMAPGASTAGGVFGQGSTTQYGTYHPPAVYMAPPMPPSTQMVPPGGAMRYQSPSFSPIIRQPAFPPRPPLGPPPMMSTGRPPIMGGMRPLPLLKPPLGMGHILPLEKPHTTIYVGKIATTIEDEFIRSVLELCGPIKSWKRAQDPTTNSPKRFGFCEYETAEGVLRALRLLNKFSMDGQDLVLNVDTTTRDYLERYVSRKKENDKLLKEAAELEKEEETAPGVEVPLAKPAEEKDSEDASGSEEAAKKFGIVNEDDKQGDDTAFEKLKSMLEERAKSKPLPPPPGPPSADLGAKSSEISVKSKDGDSNIDGTRSDDPNARIEDETTSERKSAVDGERMEASSSDRGKRTERDRERDRERDIEREREREIERVEREREKERIRRERERDHRVREAERAYEERSKEWEARERDKERQRLHDKDRDKERERERRRQIKEQEEDTDDEDDDDWRKRRHRQEEKRKRRMREREDDLTDRLKEQQEILEPKRQKLQEVPRKMEMDVDGDSASKTASLQNGAETPKKAFGSASEANKITSAGLSSNGIHEVANDGGTSNKATGDETELKLGQNFIPRKLGFGLIGAGKRTAVLPVFHEEDEEETPKEKRMRPLVPIDYSAEEMEAVNAKSLSAGPSPNLAAAAEFAKSLSGLTPRSPSKDDRRDDFDRRKQKDRSSEKGRYRERERDRERDRDKEKEREREKDRDRERDKGKDRERTKEKDRDREKERTGDKNKPPDNTKILDAKQLIDTIPKTKEELFGYPVDWSIYDKHDLHDRMRPWIAKKITEFLGEEETTLVDYILTNTRKHVTAAGMLEVLEGILDDEAEMFVLKMWRMLIFEIKRIETGLALKQPKG